jgi:hypothetical protein
MDLQEHFKVGEKLKADFFNEQGTKLPEQIIVEVIKPRVKPKATPQNILAFAEKVRLKKKIEKNIKNI